MILHSDVERIILRGGRRRNSEADKEGFIREYEKTSKIGYLLPSLGAFGSISLLTGNMAFLVAGSVYGYTFVKIDTICQSRKLMRFLEKCEKEGLNPLYLLLRGNMRDYAPNSKTNILDQLGRLGVRGEVIKYSLGLE